jgi:CHAD domain-containing protein
MTARRNEAKESLGEFARRVVRRNLRHFSQEEKAVLRDEDPEPLHQMRVGMRRLRAAIETFGFAIRLPNEANDRAIGKISRRLGRVRDLDVLLAKLGQLEGLDPQTLRTLAARREEHFEGLRDTLRGRHYEGLTNSLREWTKRPVFRTAAALPLRTALPDLLLPMGCRLFLHAGWEASSGEILHELRKRVKAVRYQAEFFADQYGPELTAWIGELKTIQDELGGLQDRVVLREAVGEVGPSLAKLLRAEEKAFAAWWPPVRERYRDPAFRQSVREMLARPR